MSGRLFLMAALAAVVGSGCVAKRAVTASKWTDSDTYYVAYVEGTSAFDGRPKVTKCRRLATNGLDCEEQTAFNEAASAK